MIHSTKGIVLRSVKYGETSLICTLFTEVFGVQTYLIQGVRSSKAKGNKAGMLQPTSLLDVVAYQKPNNNLQRLKEYQPAYLYNTIQEDVIKNSIALFSVEVLLRILPEHAIMEDLFYFSYDYFLRLDKEQNKTAGNFPCYFIIHCSKILGYEISGKYSIDTPYINLHDGAFTNTPPYQDAFLDDKEIQVLDKLLQSDTIEGACSIEMNATLRFKILDWYIAFLQQHTQHMGNIKSLPVLRALLH